MPCGRKMHKNCVSKSVYAQDILTGTAELTRMKERNAKNSIAEVAIHVYNQKGGLPAIAFAPMICTITLRI